MNPHTRLKRISAVLSVAGTRATGVDRDLLPAEIASFLAETSELANHIQEDVARGGSLAVEIVETLKQITGKLEQWIEAADQQR